MLERHVNQHFSHSENSSSSGTAAKRSLESTPNKLFRRNGKKLRYRRQPFSGIVRTTFSLYKVIHDQLMDIPLEEALEPGQESSFSYRLLSGW